MSIYNTSSFEIEWDDASRQANDSELSDMASSECLRRVRNVYRPNSWLRSRYEGMKSLSRHQQILKIENRRCATEVTVYICVVTVLFYVIFCVIEQVQNQEKKKKVGSPT